MIIAALRAFQLLFSIIVLGLSVTLINGQILSNPPSQTDYAAFCGGFGLVMAVVGIASLFVTALQGIIMTAIDALTAFLVLAGGIAFAVALQIHSCYDEDYIETNDIIRGGGTLDGEPFFNSDINLTGRCQEAQAATAFLFFSFALFAATALLGWLRPSGGNRSFV